jgi:hypothetical protein
METRQEKLLTLVIENHIATAEPVGSKFLVSEGGLDFQYFKFYFFVSIFIIFIT